MDDKDCDFKEIKKGTTFQIKERKLKVIEICFYMLNKTIKTNDLTGIDLSLNPTKHSDFNCEMRVIVDDCD
jgi:hypothetical protein